MVYYRKYRPQTISELDLSVVRERLTSILQSKSLPHAFLFTGSKGLGKTSSARILAKAINCPKKRGIEPCNECDACVSITNGTNIDVLEIDAASNGGVEEMRTLRERIKFAPSNLEKKVYIIDEVHMLSTGAFNALLKTLEEPPAHVVFILATTELHKLPETVVSRTFQVKFEKPTEEEVVASVGRIIKGERLEIEREVLHFVYKRAEGSFRDAAKIVEELSLAAGNNPITQSVFNSVFKSGNIALEVHELLIALGNKDAKNGLLIISKLSNTGSDFKFVLEELVEQLRGLLMLRNGIAAEVVNVSNLTLTDIKTLLEYSNEAYSQLKIAVVPQLPLELLIVKWATLEGGPVVQAGVSESVEASTREERSAVQENAVEPSGDDFLYKLYIAVNQESKPAAALLRPCKVYEIKNESLIITTPYPIHKDKLNSEHMREVIEKHAKRLLGKPIRVIAKT